MSKPTLTCNWECSPRCQCAGRQLHRTALRRLAEEGEIATLAVRASAKLEAAVAFGVLVWLVYGADLGQQSYRSRRRSRRTSASAAAVVRASSCSVLTCAGDPRASLVAAYADRMSCTMVMKGHRGRSRS